MRATSAHFTELWDFADFLHVVVISATWINRISPLKCFVQTIQSTIWRGSDSKLLLLVCSALVRVAQPIKKGKKRKRNSAKWAENVKYIFFNFAVSPNYCDVSQSVGSFHHFKPSRPLALKHCRWGFGEMLGLDQRVGRNCWTCKTKTRSQSPHITSRSDAAHPPWPQRFRPRAVTQIVLPSFWDW